MNIKSVLLRAGFGLLLLAGWAVAQALPPLENARPTARIVEPAAGASFAPGTTVPIRVEAVDPDGYVQHATFYVDGQKVGEQQLNFLVAPPPGEVQLFDHDWTANPPGPHHIAVIVTDNLGGKADVGVNITVKGNAENLRPKVTILEPKADARYAVGDTVSIVVETVDPDGYVPHIEYYVDGQKIGEETLHFLVAPPPGQVQQFKWAWRQASAGGHRILVVVADDRGGRTEAVREITVGGEPFQIVWVKAGSEWRYHAKNQDLGENWVLADYADQDWSIGPAQLGFGDGDEATKVPATEPRQPTVYFRRSFEVASLADIQELRVRLVRDDGAVVWLNGKRVVLANMPDGPIKFATLAAGSAGENENAWHEFHVGPALLVAGRNQLAVEVHQVALTSSDLSFDLELIGLTEASTLLPQVSIEATSPDTGEPCPVCRIAPGVFTLRRTGDPRAGLMVSLTYTGTATPGRDYAELPQRVEFLAGEATVEVRVGAFDDVLVEGDETVVATLTEPPTDAQPTYRIDPAHRRAEVVIHDDDSGGNLPVVTVKASRAETSEPFCLDCLAPLPAPGVFTISRTEETVAQALDVRFELSGTAKNGVDYSTISGAATIPLGQKSVDVEIYATFDFAVEGDETVILTLVPLAEANGLAKYRIGPDAQTAKVVIHDRSPALPVVRLTATRPETREPFLCQSKPCPLLPEPAPAVFTLSRDGGDMTKPLSVPLVFSGTARNGVDYAPLTSPVVIPAGAEKVEILVAALPDELAEGDETVVARIPIVLSIPELPQFRVDLAEAQVVIHDFGTDGVPVVSISATRATTSEGCPTCLVAPGVFTLTRTGSAANALSVMMGYAGTAHPGVDYVKLPTFVEFPAGKSSVELLVLPHYDQIPEGQESVLATIEADPTDGAVPHYRVNAEQATAWVIIHDSPDSGLVPVVSVVASRGEIAECPPNALCRIPPVDLVFHRTTPRLLDPLTILLTWGGSATWPGDYGVGDQAGRPESITFAAGSDTAKLSLYALSDCLVEGEEIVVMEIQPDPSLGPVERYRVSASQGSVRVAILDGSQPDNDMVSVVGIRSVSSTLEFCPPNADCAGVGFILTRKGGRLTSPLTVSLRYGGTASPGTDYMALPRTVVFAAGQETVSVGSGPIDDRLVEGDERIIASVGCPEDATLDYRIDGARASATVVILDNDQSTGGAFVQIVEPKSGAVFVNPESILFTARTLDPLGTMTHLDWYAGEKKIGESVIVFIREPDPGLELVHEFAWKNPPIGEHKVYAVGADAAGHRVVSDAVLVRVTRGNDRPVVTVGTGISETREVPPGTKILVRPATFILRRSGAAEHPLKVHYAIGGTAKNGRDYALLDGDATIAAGELDRVISVTPITDELLEGDEYVEFTLIEKGAYAVGTPGSARVVIHDAQSPTEPQITWVQPKDGDRFEAGSEIKLVVTSVDPAGYFGEMEFQANGKTFGRTGLIICLGLNCEPKPGTPIDFTFIWKNVEAGEYLLTAIGHPAKATGKSVKSAPIRIVVHGAPVKSFVTRTLPDAYRPGVPFKVALHATPPAGAASYGIEEHPPREWVVSNLSEGGIWDSGHGAAKFGPFLDGKERTLSYDITPLSDGAALAAFAGVASLDGLSSRIGGDQVVSADQRPHPADSNPANWTLSLNEATAYGAAWKTGAAWAIGPNPIPIDYVTRAGALWRGGEVYVFDPSAGPAPQWWVNTSANGVRPVTLNFDLSPADFAENLKVLRGRQSFALTEMISGDSTLRVRTLPGEDVRAQAVEGIIPPGASVGDVSDDGQVDVVRGVIRWGPFFDAQPRNLSARLVGVVNAAAAARASFDGESLPLLAGIAEAKSPSGPRILEVRPLADGTMQLFVVDAELTGCILEYSEDLTTWRRINEVAVGTDCQVHQDTDANESVQRYYRAVRR